MDYEQKKVTVGGVEYTLQMIPASLYLSITESCFDKNGAKLLSKQMAKILLNVVVSPKVTIDSFTGKVKELMALYKECDKFITGDDIEAEDPN